MRRSEAGDENAVARFMADDYLQTDAVGHVQDKPTRPKEYFEPIAAKIKSSEFHWQVFRKADLQVRNFGKPHNRLFCTPHDPE